MPWELINSIDRVDTSNLKFGELVIIKLFQPIEFNRFGKLSFKNEFEIFLKQEGLHINIPRNTDYFFFDKKILLFIKTKLVSLDRDAFEKHCNKN